MSEKESVRLDSLISVIVPIYNCENYIERCVDSITCQTYSNLEILLVDDGSTDYSSELCDTLAQKDKRIKVSHIPNEGVANARNYGMKQSSGKYIAFVDSDDCISPNYIEVLYETLTTHNASISTCHHISFLETPDLTVEEEVRAVTLVKPYDYCYSEYYNHTTVWGALFDERIISGLRFSQELKVGEDTYFMAQAIQRSDLIVDMDCFLYYYFHREGSLFHKPYDEDRFSEVLARDWIVDLFSSNSTKSLLSCYGARSIIALRGLRENYRDNGWDNDIHKKLVSYVRKDISKTMRSTISRRSKRSILFASVSPKLYLLLHKYLRGDMKREQQ